MALRDVGSVSMTCGELRGLVLADGAIRWMAGIESYCRRPFRVGR